MDRNEAIEIPFGAFDSELKGWEYTIPEGYEARIEGNKIILEPKESEDEKIRKEIISFIQDDIDEINLKVSGDYDDRDEDDIAHQNWCKKAIAWLEKQRSQNLANSAKACKDEPKFKVKYAGSEYNVLEVKDIAGVTYYGIEDEPNHIDYVQAENCERVGGYSIKENGSPYPTKPAVFSEQKTAWSEEDDINLGKAIWYVENPAPIVVKDSMLVEWLKSLKGRVQSQCRPNEGRQTIAANKDTEGVFGLKKNGDLIHYSKVDAKDKDEYESIVIVKGHTCIKMALHNPKGEFTFDEAQKAAASLGEGWRCPTRHEWIDIYDSRFSGLDELIKKLGAGPINSCYWTCETDTDPQYSSTLSWIARSYGYVNYYSRRCSHRVCAVSAFQN